MPNPKTLYIFLTQLYHIVIIIITLTKANPKDINYIANPEDNIQIFDTYLLLLLRPRPTPKVLIIVPTPKTLCIFLTQLIIIISLSKANPKDIDYIAHQAIDLILFQFHHYYYN